MVWVWASAPVGAAGAAAQSVGASVWAWANDAATTWMMGCWLASASVEWWKDGHSALALFSSLFYVCQDSQYCVRRMQYCESDIIKRR